MPMNGSFRRGGPFSFIGLRFACLEKLIGELLFASARQPVVAQQPRLELREVRVYDVGRVGDADVHVVVPCEQVREIAPDAQVGAAQRLVRVVGLTRSHLLRLWPGGQVLPHSLLLVELADLYWDAAECFQQAAPSVAHDA